MSIKSDLGAQLVASLQDIRCATPRLILGQLFKRETFGGGVPEYRVIDTNTSLPVKDTSELISLITEPNISVLVGTSQSSSSFKDKCKPVKLVLTNLEVTLYYDTPDDSLFNQNASSFKNNICFVLGYVGDNDTVLPMKLLDVYLVGKE